MQLGDFEQKTFAEGDTLPAKEVAEVPLLVLVLEKKFISQTKFKPEGGDAVILDVLNLATGEVSCGVLWMNGAIVDNLAPYAGTGQALPIRLAWVQAKKSTNTYLSPQPLTGADYDAAVGWVTSRPKLFAETRAEREMGEHVPEGMGTFGGAQAAAPAAAPAAVAPAAAAPAAAPAPAAAAPAAAPAPAPVAAAPAPAPVAAAPAPAAAAPAAVAAAPAPVAAAPAPATDDDVPF